MLVNETNTCGLFYEIKPFIILAVAVVRSSGLQLCRAHHRVTAPG